MIEESKEDYEINYEEFWKDIVENEDGTLNKDQVMRELSDYSMVMDNCSRAYYAMTDGIISKPNTMFFEVDGIFNSKFVSTEYNIWGCPDDIIDILNDATSLEELKKEILNYFNIIEDEENK